MVYLINHLFVQQKCFDYLHNLNDLIQAPDEEIERALNLALEAGYR